MRSKLSAIVLLATGFIATATAQAQEQDAVWVWNQDCAKPTIAALEVHLDGKTIYAASLPLCRWDREFEKGKASFRFTPARPLVWYGYRSDEGDGKADPEDTTAAGTTLEVSFWQAGGAPSAIELGYTVSASDGLHMNSLHLLSPVRRSTTTIAPGLVLETWPEKKP
jgi:hypothetical protein